MEIEYDPAKAGANIKKHGVSFDEAASVPLDPMALAFEVQDAKGESRWVLVGMSSLARLLTVVYTLRDEQNIRLIFARKATRKEASQYP